MVVGSHGRYTTATAANEIAASRSRPRRTSAAREPVDEHQRHREPQPQREPRPLRVEHQLERDPEHPQVAPAAVDERVQEAGGGEQPEQHHQLVGLGVLRVLGQERVEREQHRGEDPGPASEQAPAGPHPRRDADQPEQQRQQVGRGLAGAEARRSRNAAPGSRAARTRRRAGRRAAALSECEAIPVASASLNHSSPPSVRVRMNADTAISTSRIPAVLTRRGSRLKRSGAWTSRIAGSSSSEESGRLGVAVVMS